MKIVVADDQETVLAAVGRLLTTEGHEVIPANRWVDANRLVHQARPDVLLIDQHLDNFEGADLIRPLRIVFGHSLRIILMSSSDVAERAREVGADLFLSKAHFPQLPRLLRLLSHCQQRGNCSLRIGAAGLPRCTPCRPATRRVLLQVDGA